jgi:hypothetical protein
MISCPTRGSFSVKIILQIRYCRQSRGQPKIAKPQRRREEVWLKVACVLESGKAAREFGVDFFGGGKAF